MPEYELPAGNRYSRDDEWVRDNGDHLVVGITDYAQQQLGDVVFVELPEDGASISIGEPFGVIESVKAVSDLHAPVTGEVVESNGALEDAPELVNESCYDRGWIMAVSLADSSQLDNLMNATAYAAYVAERE